MAKETSALLIFAKAPVPGKVKTRLIPALGPRGAALLHQEMLSHTLEVAQNAGFTQIELWCAPDSQHLFFQSCQKRFSGLVLQDQRGRDLGQRMRFAVEQVLATAETAMLIGSDCPCLEGAHLIQAREALLQDFQAVLGPTEDGGYCLIGLKKPAPVLFEDMPWGETTVCEITRGRIRALGWRWYELPRLWDVDRPNDLMRLYSRENSRFRSLISNHLADDIRPGPV